jgi:UDP-N-acetylmuramoyl-L-alanine---L-glutamate ligase
MRLDDLADARVAVWGYGREGRAALAVLRQQFPGKKLTLICGAAEAIELNALALSSAETSLEIVTQAPDVAMLSAFDIVIKSPGISPYKSPIPEAERAGVRFTSGTALWFAENPKARTICVTGTKGKSTVTALIAHLLRKSGKCVAMAGNIGMPLLELSETSRKPEWWAIELSSFQTRDLKFAEIGTDAITVGVITNLYEEHLDWHGSRQRYVDDKLALAAVSNVLVANAGQRELISSIRAHPHVVRFGDDNGWHVRGTEIFCADHAILPLHAIPLPGLHNAMNVCAAMAAIEAGFQVVGRAFDARTIVSHVSSFKVLPHRLQYLGAREGLTYVNDSISTTPYATIEALRSVDANAVTVLVGGFDRGVDWNPFVEYVATHVPHAVITMGANGNAIATALRAKRADALIVESVGSLADAVARAREISPTSGAIVLSPGAPSFDQFSDYAERGREFARLAGFDPSQIAQIEGLGIE